MYLNFNWYLNWYFNKLMHYFQLIFKLVSKYTSYFTIYLISKFTIYFNWYQYVSISIGFRFQLVSKMFYLLFGIKIYHIFQLVLKYKIFSFIGIKISNVSISFGIKIFNFIWYQISYDIKIWYQNLPYISIGIKI